jgi:hypothetical protein
LAARQQFDDCSSARRVALVDATEMDFNEFVERIR